MNGIQCEPRPADVAAAIEKMAYEHESLAAGARAGAEAHSFRRYAELIDAAVVSLS